MPLTRFSLDAVLFQRANPDNTPATINRIIGFSGTIDTTAAPWVAGAVDLTIKVGSAAEETNSIDLSLAAVPAAATVAEVFAAINTAAFTDITASADVSTGRLKIVYSGAGSPEYLQVYGDGADSMDFGQGLTFPGGNLGTKIFSHLDNAKGLTDSLNLKDAEEIENESGEGTLVSIRKSEKVKGSNLVYTAIDQDNEFLHLLMGGTYDPLTDEFIMPTVLQDGMPKVSIQSFIQDYDKGAHLEDATAGYTQKKYFLVSGVRGDEANEAAALAEGVYNLAALQYTDDSGSLQGHSSIKSLTNEQLIALDLDNLVA